MRVLFVYSNQNRYLLPAPPVGLSYVATATRQAGHEVRFVDLLVSERRRQDLAQAITGFRPEVIAISVRNIDSALMQRQSPETEQIGGELLPLIRGLSAAPVVLGGPAVSILGHKVFDVIPADFAIIGEGEEAFPQLLDQLARGAPVARPGLLVAGSNGSAPPPAPPHRLTEWSASGMEQWITWRPYERAGGTWALQTKRGCSMHCIYCSYPQLEGRENRLREPSDVVDEIERVHERHRPRTFEFIDSTFNLPPSHAIAVCREIIRRKLKVRLSAMGVHPAGVTRELVDAMKQAGFIAMMLSPESASPAMLARLRKGFTPDQIAQTVELVRPSGIASAWFFLLGGPGETMATVEETVGFAEQRLDWRNCLSIFMTGIRLLPGTELEALAEREGVVRPGHDYARPVYYLSPAVTEAAIIERINRAIARHPNIAHGAEEGRSRCERTFYQVLRLCRVAPPLWRFLPLYLRSQPIAFLRGRFPILQPGDFPTPTIFPAP